MRDAMASMAIGTVSGALLLLGAGCGPAPYTIGPEEPSSAESRAAYVGTTPDCAPAHAAPAPVTVYVQQQQAALPQAAVPQHAPPAREVEDRWIPDGLPRFNPFIDARTWVGDYDCAQGRTQLTVRVVDVRGTKVRAIFDFHHAATDAAGQFLMAGTFDEQTGQVAFAPGPWIIHPTSYVSVSMVGRVTLDGTRFAGRIPFPGCTGFRLRAAR